MIDQDPALLTHQSLIGASVADRPTLVVSYLVAAIHALRPDGGAVEPDTRLADLAIDSLQIVELKFGLDQLIGSELDIEVIIANPTVRELAVESLRRAGL